MLDIAFYSNDSLFLTELPNELAERLGGASQAVCRCRGLPISRKKPAKPSPEEAENSPPDLYIVDIRQDPKQAMDFLRGLPRGADTEIMVAASGPEWAMAAYDADVMSYLPYPVDTERAARLILRRFAQRLRVEEAQFPFRTADGVKILPAERIVYVEYSDHRLLVHTDLNKRISTTTMRSSFGDAAARLLRDPRFVRTHASFLVNIMHVSQFGQYVLTMDTGAAVPISHARRSEVKRHFDRFFNRP